MITIRNLFAGRIKSFGHAFNGLKFMFREELNARIHLLAAVLVIALSILLKISKTEWIVLLLTIALVLSLEVINTALENLCDHVSTDKHTKIKKVKDLSAAAVLFAGIIAFIIGLIIFLPKL